MRQHLDEKYFVYFNTKKTKEVLRRTFEKEDLIDEVLDTIEEAAWGENTGYLSDKLLAQINEQYNVNLTQDDIGEMWYYTCDGNIMDIAYAEALTGEGSYTNDMEVYSYITAENLNIKELLSIFDEDRDMFVDALKERNNAFGEFIEKIINNKKALDDFLFYSHIYDNHFEYENKTKEELTSMLNAGDYWCIVDEWEDLVEEYPMSLDEANKKASENENFSVTLQREDE